MSAPLKLPPLFLSALREHSISGNPGEPLDFIVTKGDDEIFSNTYICDSRGYVDLYGLDKVLEPYMDGGDFAPTEFYFNGRSQIIYPCTIQVYSAAKTFLESFFLTPMMGQRDTALGRFEWLSVYTTLETEVWVYARYFNDGAFVETSELISTVDGFEQIDVSPSRFVDDANGLLVSYEIRCGDRRARFRVLPYAPAADPAIIYQNCFGCWETLYLTGEKSLKTKYTRSSAYIGGTLQTYDIQEDEEWEVYSGQLRDGAQVLAKDLARSKGVYLIDDSGEAADKIEITDFELTDANSDEDPIEFKMSYRLSETRAEGIVPRYAVKTFDNKFDNTYL